MYYASRKAAHVAMIIMQHLKSRGVIQLTPNRDGSVKFFYHKMWATMSWDGKDIKAVPMLTIRSQKRVRDEVRLPGNAQAFEQAGNAWNHPNPQHDADNPDRKSRRNAFGELCQKPTVEGYEGWGPLGYNRKAHERLARLEKRTEPDNAARKLAQVRMAYRSGK